jgi:hypothetical protein
LLISTINKPIYPNPTKDNKITGTMTTEARKAVVKMAVVKMVEMKMVATTMGEELTMS